MATHESKERTTKIAAAGHIAADLRRKVCKYGQSAQETDSDYILVNSIRCLIFGRIRHCVKAKTLSAVGSHE